MSDMLTMTGSDVIWGNLQDLTAKIKDRILKAGVRRAAAPIEAAMKSGVRSDHGVLADAIQTKITSRGGVGTFVRATVGIRRGVKVPVRIVKRGPHKGSVLIAVPTKYASKVEFGHKIVANGVTVGYVGPKPFARPAWDEWGGEVALFTICDEMQKQITQEMIRYAITASKP